MSGIAKLTLPDLQQPWQLEIDTGIATADNSFGARVAYDERLLEQVAAGEKAPTIRIWRNRQCLVATVKESHKSGFEAACSASALENWPVAVRRTGGTCVPHGPGVLNLALVYPRPLDVEWSMEDSYKLLCAPLQRLLESYALEVETGEVPGSFCDGKFNLQVDNRKLVGTSQRWKGNPALAGSVILSHACLLVDLDLLEATARINQFYRLCGYAQQFDPFACATLRECTAGPAKPFSAEFVEQVTERLSNIIVNEVPDDSSRHQ
ncbi:MAG: hypothetical protein O7F73_05510 [Gammaproteobacteria bacterium]|nr:hypothetical protein [Gammaproteobacteria bacterium]